MKIATTDQILLAPSVSSFVVYGTTCKVALLLILYRVASDSITMQPMEGLPEPQLPPWMRKSERPHMLLEEAGYSTVSKR
jgi:hypothetical protein